MRKRKPERRDDGRKELSKSIRKTAETAKLGTAMPKPPKPIKRKPK